MIGKAGVLIGTCRGRWISQHQAMTQSKPHNSMDYPGSRLPSPTFRMSVGAPITNQSRVNHLGRARPTRLGHFMACTGRYRRRIIVARAVRLAFATSTCLRKMFPPPVQNHYRRYLFGDITADNAPSHSCANLPRLVSELRQFGTGVWVRCIVRSDVRQASYEDYRCH